MIELTKDADKLLCTLYKEYLERRKSGLSKSDATSFEDSDDIRNQYFPKWSSDDAANVCWELHNAEYVHCCPGDDLANDVELRTEAIIYMENRFKNGLKDVLTFLSNFIP